MTSRIIRDNPGGEGVARGTSVFDGFVCDGKLPQVVTDHLRLQQTNSYNS